MAGTMQIILRAVAEPGFRETLFSDFEEAVGGYALDADEKEALRAVSRRDLERIIGGMMAHLFVPIRASRRVLVIPQSRTDIAPGPGDVVVRIAPSLMFGNGAHETTRMVLQALEDFLRPGDDVLDIGAGTGIVSIAAIGLGAGSALGLDINPEAVAVARENIRLNEVGGANRLARAEVGTLSDVLDNRLGLADPTFDVVVANILTPVILDFLGEGIVRTLKPGGRLIASGILTENADSIIRALPAAGLEKIEQRKEGRWSALVLGRRERYSLASRWFRGGRRWPVTSTR